MVLAVVLALAGCREERDPRAELQAAVLNTATEAFTFDLAARADRAALDQLGDDAVAAAEFLAEANVSGARDPGGQLQLSISLGGPAPLLEVIALGDGELLLRTGLGGLLGLEGRDPGEALAPALERAGVGEAGRAALTTSFVGGWVALTDVGDLGELLGGAAQDGGDDDAALFDLRALVGGLELTAVRDAGEVRRFDVGVPAAALFGPLGVGGDQVLPGTVDVRDGRLSEVRVELSGSDLAEVGDDAGGTELDGADAAPGSDDAAGGVVELVLQVTSARGEGPLVERPDPGASLTAAELLTLVEQLQVVTGGGASSPSG